MGFHQAGWCGAVSQLLTFVIQVIPHLTVAVTPGRNVEIALDLVQIQTAIDPAAVRSAANPWSLCPLGPLLAQRNNVVDVLLSEALLLVAQILVARARVDPSLAVLAELVNPLCVDPLVEVGLVAVQPVRGHDAVARGVLHVDVNVVTLHAHHNVQVDLQLLRDALFHGKVVCLGAAPPAGNFAPDEEDRDEGHGDGPFAAACRSRDVLRL